MRKQLESLFLNRNEYFFTHPTEVIRALTSPYEENFVSHYAKSSELDSLKSALSNIYNVDKEHILLGHGAEDIFVKILSWFRKERDAVVIEDFSWANYLHIAEGFQYEVFAIPTLEGADFFRFNYQAFYNKLSQLKSGIVFVTSPNNPTGHLVDSAEFYKLASSFPEHIFILDSVYNEIISKDYAKLFKLKNIIFVGSFSKFFGMPGLRLGYAIGTLPKAFQLNLGLQPSTIHAALAALNNINYYQENRHFMLQFTRSLLTKKWKGLKIYKSFAPFFLVKIEMPLKKENFAKAEAVAGIIPKYIHRTDSTYIRFGLGPQDICNRVEMYLQFIERMCC